jgi:hypothetical protein
MANEREDLLDSGGAPRRISPSMAVALLALIVAMGGTAYATGLITGGQVQNGSLTGRDVKDDSIKSRDVSGLTMSDFKDGAFPRPNDAILLTPGPRGLQGPPGDPGPLLETLPSGRTLRGVYAASGGEGLQMSISYPLPLAKNSTKTAFLDPADPRPEGCPTTGADEVAEAAPGWLCVYQTNEDANNNIESRSLQWGRFGFFISAGAINPALNIFLEGRWAVTAP